MNLLLKFLFSVQFICRPGREKSSIFQLVSVVEQVGLSLTLTETLKTRFLAMKSK